MDRMERYERDIQQMKELDDSFDNTKTLCKENVELVRSIEDSVARQRVVCEEELSVEDDFKLENPKEGKVVVSTKKTLEAAMVHKEQHVAVLNFACAMIPGGGHNMTGGSQEECLCRESTLYSCISDERCMKEFYEPHQDLSTALYNGDQIYTPGVTVFKDYDTVPKLRKESEWFTVDVITMAAPNMALYKKWAGRITDDEVIELFRQRFTRVMREAMLHRVDVLILGAFGCGEFGNDPALVATGAARALEKYREAFDVVEFAIPTGRSKVNYRMFRLILDRYINNQ